MKTKLDIETIINSDDRHAIADLNDQLEGKTDDLADEPGRGTTGPKYPHVTVQLTGLDGNAFNVLGVVGRALRRAKVDPAEVTQYTEEATAGDYDHLLQVTMRWVNVR